MSRRKRVSTPSAVWPWRLFYPKSLGLFLQHYNQINFHETRKFTSFSPPSARITVKISVGCDWHLHCAFEATYLYDDPMIRIETSERRDLVMLALSGRIESHDLPELKRQKMKPIWTNPEMSG
jgi:hypothetical protein